ncbi:hypothetical protein HGRIS_000090 [Hohenbuehelia grisea]|uniref:Uncharacterized protein n=1 Tax=Hohenbuehelia grisea TaxID=104357 RepID=A0ABR3JQN0_9AGAR
MCHGGSGCRNKQQFTIGLQKGTKRESNSAILLTQHPASPDRDGVALLISLSQEKLQRGLTREADLVHFVVREDGYWKLQHSAGAPYGNLIDLDQYETDPHSLYCCKVCPFRNSN